MIRLIIIVCSLVLLGCKPFKAEKTEEQNIISPEEQEELIETLSSESKYTIAQSDTESTPNIEASKIQLPQLNVKNAQESLNDNCLVANSIRKEIILYMKDSSYSITPGDFISYLKDNAELDKPDCFFPRNDDELLLLYHFTEKLEIEGDYNAINIIISLDLYMSRVTEYAEYMHDVIPRLSLINTLWFIQSVNSLSEKSQSTVLENLEYLSDMKAVEKLRLNLSEIKESKYQLTISLANESINRIFE